jgi:hypothetical protein
MDNKRDKSRIMLKTRYVHYNPETMDRKLILIVFVFAKLSYTYITNSLK